MSEDKGASSGAGAPSAPIAAWKRVQALLLELSKELERAVAPPAGRDHWHRAAPVIMPDLEHELAQLVYELLAPPYPEEPEALMAEIRRRDSVRDHMIKVAARVQTPAELRAALVADGTIPDEPVMEWYDRDGHYRDVKHGEWQPNLHKLHEQWPR